MRMMFGALGLLIVVAIVGVVAKNQLRPGSGSPASSGGSEAAIAVPSGTPKQQIDQVKQSVENALQQSRPVDDTK